jgi:hypothetical protein
MMKGDVFDLPQLGSYRDCSKDVVQLRPGNGIIVGFLIAWGEMGPTRTPEYLLVT